MEKRNGKSLADMVAARDHAQSSSTSVLSISEQIRRAIVAAGLPPPERIIADGKIHRFPTSGKRSDSAGWYVLFDGPVPAGRFGCWRTGVNEKWRGDIGRRLSAIEAAEHRKLTEAMMRMAQEDRQSRRDQAKTNAAALWDVSPPACPDHPYLQRKAIEAHGLRQTPMHGDLLVPVCDARGTIQ